MGALTDPGALVRAKVAALFDESVAVAVTDPKMPQPALFPGEAHGIAGAIAKRQQEFAAGRAVARSAMAELGLKPAAIPSGPDRAPIWPVGVTGSISHTDDICIAVLGRASKLRALGVDIEAATTLDADLIGLVCSDAEQARIAGPDFARKAKLIFSAKEAAYKAQYPLSGMLFGFDHLDVSLSEETGSFVATFVEPAAPFAVGDTLPGRFVRIADQLVTAVTIGQDTSKGA